MNIIREPTTASGFIPPLTHSGFLVDFTLALISPSLNVVRIVGIVLLTVESDSQPDPRRLRLH